MTDLAVHIQDVSKTLLKGERSITALQHINLEIQTGECVALMGHNGAGKSTLLRTLCGLVWPDQGRLTVLGSAPSAHQRQQHPLGYMTPNERSFNWRLTGRENLHYFGSLCGLRKTARSERMDRWAAAFNVDYLDQRFDQYSTGMRQHLALLRVMLHDPQLLLLDEPARSLDADSCRRVIDALGQLRDAGKTILLATHLMPLAQELCSRVITMKNGAIEQDRGKPEWDRPPVAHVLTTNLLSSTEQEILNKLPEVARIEMVDGHPASNITLTVAPEALQTVLARCHSLGIYIWECRQEGEAS